MKPIDYTHQTTLITGASSGIGLALGRALAARGSDLVLVARRLDRLEQLAEELRTTHHVGVETIALDLTLPNPGTALAEEVDRRGIHVTSLINNAGVGTDGPFRDEDPAQLTDLIALNVTAVVDITRAFIGPVSDAGNGMLVTIASMAGYQPIPGMAAYAATKAFVLSFTEALWWEMRSTGVRTLAFSPGLTRTEFFDEIGGEEYTGSFQTPEQVAEAALRALDRRRSTPSAVSGRRNGMTTLAPRLLSRRMTVLSTAHFAGATHLMTKNKTKTKTEEAVPSPIGQLDA